MEKIPDWLDLWKQLSELQNVSWHLKKKKNKKEDHWKNRAKKFEQLVDKRWDKPDSSRDTIVKVLKKNPGSTIIDIGAGTGAWSVLMAQHASKVTAVEPSDSMGAILTEKIKNHNVNNIEIIKDSWPDLEMDVHDFTFASHSMYGCTDLKAFIKKMEACTRKTCFFLIRAPYANSIMWKISKKILGQPYDSPNFQVAYNALLNMNIYPHVQIEDSGTWEPWNNESIEEAVNDIKARLNVTEETTYDEFIKGIVEKELRFENGRYIWPGSVRSALIFWEKESG